MPGGAGAPYRKDGGPYTREHEEGGPDNAGLARELQQIHNQLRSEIEQEQNQVAQLAAQLRAMKGQHGQQQGAGIDVRKDQPSQRKQGFNELPAKK